MKLNIAVLAGDGIGPEIVAQGLRVTEAIARKFGHELHTERRWSEPLPSMQTGNPYPDETHELCMKSDAVLFGAIGHPRFDNDPSAKVRPEQDCLPCAKTGTLCQHPSTDHLSFFVGQIPAQNRAHRRGRFCGHPRTYRRDVFRRAAGTQ